MKKIYLFSKTPTTDQNIIHIPIIKTEFLSPEIDFNKYDYFIVTSKESINFLLNISHKTTPLIIVSDVTAEYAKEQGFNIAEVGDGYGESLKDILINKYDIKRVLYLAPKISASDFVKKLNIDSVIIYETHCNGSLKFDIEDDAILAFTSPSSVNCFLKKYLFKESHTIAVIGKSTYQVVENKSNINIAKSPSVEELIKLCYKLK